MSILHFCLLYTSAWVSRETNKLDENKDDKVSRGESYDNISKNMVLENNGVNIGSDNEILVGVEFDNEVIKSVDELERKCDMVLWWEMF